MKKLLFIGIVALMVQSLGAVTLPSTSYSPYAGGSSSGTEQSLLSGGTMLTGSYSVLGAYDECTKFDEGACESCCDSYLQHPCFEICLSQGGDPDTCASQCGGQQVKECKSACHGGGSLPLDGGLSILLVLGIAGGAFKVFRARQNQVK
ncbi:MAG: hypothetical protein MJ003_01630 [Paludibacteraceae bacterium]|nr:hypothetical protein [Paludibacteraceae bacterium]